MRVLGVDPGTHYVGYGIVDWEGTACKAVKYGRFCIKPNLKLSEKLKQIYDSIMALMAEIHVDTMAVEDVFVSCNARSSLKLGHARGVILLAAAQQNVPVYEYAPREIKQAVLGNGNASKTQVQWMMKQLLRLGEAELEEDAADGLAVAVCHAYRSGPRFGNGAS